MAKANEKFTAKQVIAAIKDTGGIKTIIARNLSCHRHTVDRYIEKYATVHRAYKDECERVGDFAESVLIQNIRLAFQQQAEDKVQVDSTDAKWYLERKRRGEFARKQEIDLDATGTIIQLVGVDPDAGED